LLDNKFKVGDLIVGNIKQYKLFIWDEDEFNYYVVDVENSLKQWIMFKSLTDDSYEKI